MDHEDRNRKNRSWQRFRATQHIGMGIFYLIAGSIVLYIKYFGYMALSPGAAYTLGSLMVVYGIFRIWRGIKDTREMRAGK